MQHANDLRRPGAKPAQEQARDGTPGEANRLGAIRPQKHGRLKLGYQVSLTFLWPGCLSRLNLMLVTPVKSWLDVAFVETKHRCPVVKRCHGKQGWVATVRTLFCLAHAGPEKSPLRGRIRGKSSKVGEASAPRFTVGSFTSPVTLVAFSIEIWVTSTSNSLPFDSQWKSGRCSTESQILIRLDLGTVAL